MQVVETNAEGLKREYRVTIEAAAIDERLASRLQQLKDTVRMKGFRPGKVPVSLLRRMYGEPLRNEVRMELIEQSSRSALEEREIRPALQPSIDVVKSGEEGEDLEYTMGVEILPEIGPIDLSELELERIVAEVDDATVDEAVQRLAEQQKSFTPREAGDAAQDGDSVIIDFEGKRDGQPMEQAKAEDFELVLGSHRFIPGFEEQLVGAKAGDQVTVNVTFPENYPAKEMAGVEATFDVTVKEVRAPEPTKVDDELAKRLGFESLEALRQAIRDQIRRDYEAASRTRLKRGLLDALDQRYHFDVPEGMVRAEFQQIWSQVKGRQTETAPHHDHDHDHEHGHNHEHAHGAEAANELTAAAESAPDPTEAEERAEYERIAERRVRLGLLLAEIGRMNDVTVPDEELNQALISYARRFSSREQQVYQQVARNPQLLAQVRAPLYEDKVVDFIVAQAKITDRIVERQELFRDPDDEAAEAAPAGETEPETEPGHGDDWDRGAAQPARTRRKSTKAAKDEEPGATEQ